MKNLLSFQQFLLEKRDLLPSEQEKKIKDEDKKYTFGKAMLHFNFPDMKIFHERIEADDLTGDGLETEPYVTILYGLHSDDINDEDVIRSCTTGVSSILLHNISCFENEDYDVLKFDVRSSFLHDMNKELVKFPHTNDYPDYSPHCTIAYLKSGKGKKYIEEFGERSYEVFPTKVIYSKPDGTKIRSGFKLR
jgi:hypothetical protein